MRKAKHRAVRAGRPWFLGAIRQTAVMARWLLLCLATALCGAADIGWDVIDNPQAIRIRDATLRTRWERLFEAPPIWSARQVAYLGRRAGDQAFTLLASRLVYRGEPWGRGRSVNARQWQPMNREVKLAVLREMRCSGEAVYAPLLAGLLQTEADPKVATDLLISLWMLRPVGIEELAQRLADPRLVAPTRLPAADHPTVRSTALDLLLGLRGADDQMLQGPLDWACTRASGGERIHALNSIPDGARPELVTMAVLRLADELRLAGDARPADPTALEAWVLALDRLNLEKLPEQRSGPAVMAALLAAAIDGSRGLAVSAAAALDSTPGWAPGADGEKLARRAADPGCDPMIRHAVLGLLTRTAPQTVPTAAPPGDAWARLAAHRERLAKWEWERFIR